MLGIVIIVAFRRATWIEGSAQESKEGVREGERGGKRG